MNLVKNERKKHKDKKKKKKHKKNRHSSESPSSDSQQRKPRKHERPASPSPISVRQKVPGYGLKIRDSHSDKQRPISPPPDQPKASHSKRGRSRSRSPPPQHHRDLRRENPHQRTSASTSPSPPRRSKVHSQESDKRRHGRARSPSPKRGGGEGGRYQRRPHSDHPRKFPAEELEQRRLEMMENARWRDETRQQNIKRYKQEEEREKELEKKDNGEGKFLHKMKLQSAATSSLEDRVKRNVHSIQRTSAALEKNFMKR
uniref:Pre-mRNA-splicing factor CWC25-like protein n=2 Tax=Callorhinchus milii TaxID=7868 RepID=A0A4W3H688_CALMI